MSKSKDSDSEVDIYGDLPNFSSDNTISELENAKKNLENELRALKLKLKDIQVENDKLKKENEALSMNISSLYKTAACEIKRKDQMIQELRKEKDAILFRRQRNESQKYSHRHDAPRPAEDMSHRYDTRPADVQVIDEQPSIENDVCIVEENRQYNNYTYNQHVDDVQNDDYYEDEVIATFPEEEDDEDCVVQNTPKEVPDTIFSRRKAQQLKLLMKRSESVKDSTRVDIISEDSVKIIADSNKTQNTIFDRRKNQKLKSHNEQQGMSEVTVEVDTGSSPALEDGVFIVKEKLSNITLGTKNIDLSHKKTELLTSKHLNSVRKTVEANVKTYSEVKELPSASVKATQSSRTEEVKAYRTKSYHKSKEDSHAAKIYSEKHSHVSSKDKRSGSVTHSHRKSSSSSKFSTHSSSPRSGVKNSLSPRSPKGRSIRETSVSRALKSLRSKSQLEDLDRKSSKSKKERDRRNEGRKKADSQEHKKADHVVIKSQVSSKLLPEKSQPNLRPLSEKQLVTEDVCTKSKLAPDTAKTLLVPDSKASANVNQEIYTKTKSHSDKETHLQQERMAKSSEKEPYSTQTNIMPEGSGTSCEKSIMEMQTNKTLHNEDSSKTATVSSMLSEECGEVQRSANELRQERSSEVMTDRKTLVGAVPTSSDVMQKVGINQTSNISQKDGVSDHSGSSQKKSISETPMDTDLPLKKRIGETPAGDREVIEKVSRDEQHNECVSEKLPGENILHKKGVCEDITDFDSTHKEDVTVDSLTSAKESNKASDDSSVTLKTILPNMEAEVSAPDTLPRSKHSSNNMTSTELKTWTENAKTTRSAEALQDSLTTNQDDVMPAENSDLSANMHIEENNALSSCHEKRRFKTFHFENLQNGAPKDKNRNCSIAASKNFDETEPEHRPIDGGENDQNIVSSTLQTDIEERDTSGVSEMQPISEERSEDCLLNKDANPSSQEPVCESLAVEKEQTKSVNQSFPNPNESLSPTATFKKGNVSIAVVNEPGSFRRRKFKRISSNISNSANISNAMKKASDEHLHNEKLSGTKRSHEHMDTEGSVSPPVKKQAFADPQRDQLYAAAVKDKSIEDYSQAHLESSSTQENEKNPSVTETNTSNDKNNTIDLEEGEIEDDSDEKTSESNQILNKDVQRVKVVKSVIRTESNIRKEQSRKYLELGRKVRENRRKPHGSHLQEVARGSRDKHNLPNKLFSHCKRRSPSELLIKDRNIKKGSKQRDNSRSRSTSSETSKSTNERLRERYRNKENKVDTKSSCDREEMKDKAEASNINRTKENKMDTTSSCIREEKIEMNDKAEASNINKSVLHSMHVNKPKDLSAWTQLGKSSSSRDRGEAGHAQSSRKENTVTHNDVDRDSFKIPAVSNQTVTPISKYIIKRKKVCNLQDNVSVPVVSISPPKPRSESVNESCESVHLKTVAASKADMQASQLNLIPSRKTNFSSQSKETVLLQTSPSTSRSRVSHTSVSHSRISAGKSSLRLCKTSTSQVSSDSSACTSSSSSEYENNSDETWNPKRRRKKRTRKNPKTEVTKSKTSEINL